MIHKKVMVDERTNLPSLDVRKIKQINKVLNEFAEKRVADDNNWFSVVACWLTGLFIFISLCAMAPAAVLCWPAYMHKASQGLDIREEWYTSFLIMRTIAQCVVLIKSSSANHMHMALAGESYRMLRSLGWRWPQGYVAVCFTNEFVSTGVALQAIISLLLRLVILLIKIVIEYIVISIPMIDLLLHNNFHNHIFTIITGI